MADNTVHDYIIDTPVTISWLKEKMLERVANNKNINLESWSAETTGENKGFLSFIIRVVFQWSEHDEALPESVIIKCPTDIKMKKMTEEILPEACDMLDVLKYVLPLNHNKECTFYCMWDGQPNVPLKIPKCYVHQEITEDQVGVLVLEDLSDVLSQQTVGHGLTIGQLKQVAENLAGLHAWSLTHDGWPELYPPLPTKFFDHAPASLKMMFDKLKDICPELFDPDMIDEVAKHATSADCIQYAFSLHEEMNMPPVLVHGDLWVNNMMFTKKVSEDGKTVPSDELLTIFDWQTCYPGCASADFVRMACTSMSAEMRREKLPSIMHHYYNTLRDNLGKEPLFTYDTLMKSYSKGLKAGFFGGFGILTAFLVQHQEIYGGEEFIQKVIERARCLLEDTVANLSGHLDVNFFHKSKIKSNL